METQVTTGAEPVSRRSNSIKRAYRFVFGHRATKSKDLTTIDQNGEGEKAPAVAATGNAPVADGPAEANTAQAAPVGAAKPAENGVSVPKEDTKPQPEGELGEQVRRLEAEYAAKERALEERKGRLEEIIAGDVVEKIAEAKRTEREKVEASLQAAHQEELVSSRKSCS